MDIDLEELRRRAAVHGFREGDVLCVPISVLPKGLIFDFDAKDGRGEALSLANRGKDSELATALVVRAAITSDESLSAPPMAVEEIIFNVAHGFETDEMRSALKWSSGSRVLHELSTTFEITVEAADYEWWSLAWEASDFRAALRTYARDFISLVVVDSKRSTEIVKIRRLEQAADSARSIDQSDAEDPSDFSMAAYDVGRATSEHLRVIAPTGTFFTDAWLVRSRPGSLSYSERTAVDRLAFYTQGVEPGDHFVYAKLWPQRSGFMRPAKYLSGYGAAILLLGALAEVWTAARWGNERGFLWDMSKASDAAAALILTLPTILIAYIVRDGEHDVRSLLLARWRTLALFSLVPLWCAAITLMIGRKNLQDWSLWAVWLGLGVVALAIHGAIQAQDYRLNRAYKRREASPETRNWTVTTEEAHPAAV